MRKTLGIIIGSISVGSVVFSPTLASCQNRAPMHRKRAAASDSISLVLESVRMIDRDSAVIEISRSAREPSTIHLRITSGAKPRDLAQAILSIQQSPASTVIMQGGEIRSYVLESDTRREPAMATAENAAKLLNDARKSATTKTAFKIRLPLAYVADSR
jgi:hypothetical protein